MKDQNRCPGISYSDMLNLDTRDVPQFLIDESPVDFDPLSVSTERYTSEDFAHLENEKMWRNVWQFAAREEELLNPGENVVYENAGRSYVLIRQDDGSVRAFHNVCLHRGRKLRTKSGYAPELKCPFHGFTWNNDGSLKDVPCRWDFEHIEEKDMSLPELRVERWQGFIMVTENPDIEPFHEWIGEVNAHYEHWKLDECYTSVWVGRVLPCNWKVAAEAFMEAYHSVVTHPQILPFTGDSNTRYDLYGDHVNRAITPSASCSPHVAHMFNEDYVIDKLSSTGGRRALEETGFDLEKARANFDGDDPVLARKVIAESNRHTFGADCGRDFSDISDTEMVDNFTYNVFPNFSPWGGFVPNLLYRWRPGETPDTCFMEIRILMRAKRGEPKPPSAKMFVVASDEPFLSASEVMGELLAKVFDQDLANLPEVQKGLKSSFNQQVHFGSYQESRIRHFAQTLEKYLNA